MNSAAAGQVQNPDDDKENVIKKRCYKDLENLSSPSCSVPCTVASRDPLRSNLNIGAYDRANLVAWMMEACEAFSLTCETLHLSVNYMDRCLSKLDNVDKKQFQILATACLYVASKLEEVYPPSLHEFANIADHLCKPWHVANQEIEILRTLDWQVRITPASACLNHLCQCYDMTRENRYLSDNDFKRQPPEVQMPSRKMIRRVTSMAPSVRRFITVSQTTYDPKLFLDGMKILNLAILDRNWSRYSGMTLAAASLRFATGKQLPQVPNLSFNEYMRCVHWMQPFHEVMKSVPGKVLDLDMDRRHKLPSIHRMQRSEATVTLLREAHALKPQNLPRQLFANISNRRQEPRPPPKRRRLQAQAEI